MLPGQLNGIVCHTEDGMGEGESDKGVDAVPLKILKNVIWCRNCEAHTPAHNRGCTAGDFEGDRHVNLEQFTGVLTQIESDRWKSALQIAN